MTRPGGLALAIVHNVEAVSARLLGRRSRIVDLEHTHLYSPRTLARLFAGCGSEVRRVGRVTNRCSLYYPAWVAPLPLRVKGLLLKLLRRSAVARVRLRLPLGNLYLIAQRPSGVAVPPG